MAADGTNAFTDARDMLFNLYRFDSKVGAERCAMSFNQWLDNLPAEPWQTDPMVASLPPAYRQTKVIANLAELKIDESDVEYMETCLWMRDVATWVAETSPEPHFADWLESQPGVEDPERLLLATQLFDWTIRNVQLRKYAPVDVAQSIIPGSRLTVRWVMLRGIGDPMERARVFIGLCRQAEIPSVMLAIRNSKGGLSPWCPAALIGGKLYLFDTKLGLPIPAADDEGVATLAQARADSSVLKSLSLGSEFPYAVQSGDLKEVVALLDATPLSLSRRMALIENRLTGEQRLRLTVLASERKEELAPLGVTTQLWDLPYYVMRRQLLERIRTRDDPKYAWQVNRQESLFVGTDDLISGRKLHMHGQFSLNEDQDGAKQSYMKVRYADDFLERLPTDRQVQQMFGFEKTSNIRDEEWVNYMRGVQQRLREEKMHVSFWIGLIHYEEGNFETASHWFSKRVIEENANSVWAPSAKYNLARCYERVGKLSDARAIYLEDESPQQHGNLLRSRRLKKQEP